MAKADLLTDKEVSALLGVTVAALAQWRHRGQGPVFVREGRWIRYRRSDVDAWIAGRADLTSRLGVKDDTSEAARTLGRKGGFAAQARRSPEARAAHAAMMRAAKAAKGAAAR